VGRADDPSALFYNPAGITQLPGLQVMGGATAITPGTEVTTTDPVTGDRTTTETEDNVWIPPHLYATYQFTDKVWFGLGIFSPFGLGTEFDEDWPGRYNSYEAIIQSLTINPNIAVKVTDKLSLAAGLEAMWFDLSLKKKIPTGPPTQLPAVGDLDMGLEGDSFGYGFNLAGHYKALSWLSLGISYRSQVKQHVEGEADFTNTLSPFGLFRDTDASGTITLPDELFLGIAFYPIERLSLEISGVWTRWSTYDELTITFDDPIVPNVNSSTAEKKWHDTWRIQFGVEYKATDWLDLRAGYTFDEEPVDTEFTDYLVPANDRHLFSFGPGFYWNNFTLDLSYTYLMIETGKMCWLASTRAYSNPNSTMETPTCLG